MFIDYLVLLPHMLTLFERWKEIVTLIQRINKCILEFMESWNNHALSSEGSMSPNQLFLEGRNVTEVPQNSVTTMNVTIEHTRDRVEIPRIQFVPCSALLHILHGLDPLQPCPSNGATLFKRALHIAGQHLTNQCSQCSE